MVGGSAVTVSVRVANRGDQKATGSVVESLMGTPADGSSTIVFGQVKHTIALKPGASTTFQVKLLAGAATLSGSYTVSPQLTAVESLAKANVVGQSLADVRSVSISQPVVTLAAHFVGSQNGALFVGSRRSASTSVKLRLVNTGSGVAQGRFSASFAISSDAALDAADPVVGIVAGHVISLRPGASTVISGRLVLPAGTTPGSYRVFAVLDSSHTVAGNTAAGSNVVSPSPLVLTNVPPPHSHDHSHDHGGGGGGLDNGIDDGLFPGPIDDGSSDNNEDSSGSTSSGNDNGSSTTAPTDSGDTDTDFGGDSGGSDFGGGGDDGGGADF